MRHAIAFIVVTSIAGLSSAQTPPQSQGWVVLPVADYRALHEKAYPPQPAPEPPPVNAAITRVEYDLAVQGDGASGQARVTVDVFKDGWVSVPMPAWLRVRDAKIDGRPVTLVYGQDGKGATDRSVLLSRAGRSVITLDLSVPITAGSGAESMVLPALPSAVQRVSLSLKSPDLALTVSGGLISERTSSGQATRFLICGQPDIPLGLAWSRRRENIGASQPLRLRGDVTEVVGLGEDSAQVSAQVNVDVLQGAADRVTLKLPAAFTVSQVAGSLVADWEAKDTELIVSLLEPVERAASFTVTGELKAPRDGRIAVPILRVANAERETGGIAVEVLGAGEIKETSQRGLDAADAADLGPMVSARQSPALVAFRSRPQAWDAPRALEVTVARYTPQAILLANIEEARYTVLLTEDGKTLVEAAYAVRNSQRSFVAVTLPPGATLWTASVDGRPVRPGRTTDGALLLPILKDRGRANVASAVRLFYIDRGTQWTSAAEAVAKLRLPAVDLPVSRTGAQVYHSPRYRLTLEPGPFRLEPYAPPESATLRPTLPASSFRLDKTEEVAVSAARPGGAAGGGVGRAGVAPPPPPPPPKPGAADEREMRDLVNQYQRANRAGPIAGLLPIDMRFPAYGPSIFVATELTPESKAPEVRFTFKREVK